MRLRRRREIRLRRSGHLVAAALGIGAWLCSEASLALSDELVRNPSHTHLSGVVLSLCLMTVAVQTRK